MPAAVHRLAEARVPKPKPPPVPPAPAPGSYPYCLGQPVAALRSRVEMAAELLRLTGRPFDWDSAVADYMVETDGGRDETFGLEDRAARWGWDVSRSTMSRRMGRVREDAADRADLYRSKRAADARLEAERRRAEAAARFGAPDEADSNPPVSAERDCNADATARNDGATETPKTSENGASVQRDETEAERPCNGGATGPPHTSRAFRPQTHTQGELGPRARARAAVAALGFDAPALVAEAEDSAAGAPGALVGPDLVAAALCLQLTGRVPEKARAALDGLDPPAAAAVLVAVLRTGDTPRTGPRTNYLVALARSLSDHDRRQAYADAHPDRPQDLDPGTDRPPDGGRQRGRGGAPAPRNARERANQLSARDVADSSADALALLRADPDLRRDAPE